MAVSDDAFEAYAKQQEAEALAASQRGNGGGFPANYEEIQWTGLEPNKMKIIRAVGGPPDSGLDKTTARTVRISYIYGDDGKPFRCILPERSDDPGHLLWKIISRVKAVEWIDKKRVNVVEQRYPEIYNIITKNGLSGADKRAIYDRGWEGQLKLVMNVIDREQMDWHKEHKHTMLLSKNIGVGKDGRLWPEEGVPSWGFSSLLGQLFKFYKSWEKYDIGITRTGIKETPYRVINACKHIEEVTPPELANLVVNLPLTEEEASWERYDLSKIFGVTRYTKIYNKLRVTIARIDATLGTNFEAELKNLVEKEKEEFAAMRAANEGAPEASEATYSSDVPGAATPAAESPQTRTPVASTSTFDTSKLLGWNELSNADKALISGVTVNSEGAVTELQFTDPNLVLLGCNKCKVPSPESFTVCPACGLHF